MSTADGKIRFDTEINNKNLEKGMAAIQKMMESFAKNGGDAFEKVDKAAESVAETMEKVAESGSAIKSEELDKLVQRWDNLNAQIEVQQKLLESLQDKYQRVANLKGPDSEEALKLQKSILKAEEALDKMIEKSDQYAKKAEAMEQSSNQAAAGIGKTGKEAASSAGNLDKVASSAQKADGNLDSVASSANSASQALGGISDNADGAASGVEQLGSAAEGFSGAGSGMGSALNMIMGGLQSLPGASGTASNVISTLAGSVGGLSTSGAAMAGVIGGTAVAAVTALGVAIGKLFESTEEMREGFATLQVNADAMSVSMVTVNEGMKEFSLVSEDFNANVEAMSNLLAAGFTDSNMATIVERLSDAVIKFPDTLKIESLADSLQETIATKEAVGQFGELLGRVGINVEKFNEGLKRAAESGREQQYVLQQLSRTDLPGLTDAYKRNNAAVVEAKESQYRLDQAMAELARELEPLKMGFDSFVNNLKIGFIKTITDAIKSVKELIQSLKDLWQEQQRQNMATPTAQITGGFTPMRTAPEPEIIPFARGERVLSAPQTNSLLRLNEGSEGIWAGFSGVKQADLSSFLQSLKGLINMSAINLSNSITVNLNIDGFDGFMEILEGLKEYPLSVQKGWAGF